MDLIIEHNLDIIRTRLLRAEDGSSPVYDVHTEGNLYDFPSQPTTIYKLDGNQRHEVGRIEWPNTSQNLMNIESHGKRIGMQATGLLGHSLAFQASDNQWYKWRYNWKGHPILTKKDNSKYPIASYKPGAAGVVSKYKEPRLRIAPEGMAIAEEVVATFVGVDEAIRARSRPSQKITTRPSGNASGHADRTS